jgi:SRSO17 transposase
MRFDDRIVDHVEKAMDGYHKRFERFFGRSEPREQSRKYMQGLIAAPDRRNGWELAEAAGDAVPDPTQRLLYRSNWDVDAVRDEHIRYSVEHLGDPNAVFIHDETGFLKSGKSSAGVHRQYTGTAGKITNCQVGVFLAYSGAGGCLLLDRALYMPRCWLDDPARCKSAAVPASLPFATKPTQALWMLQHAVTDLRVPGKWVTADEVYGNCPTYRQGVYDLGLLLVGAVSQTLTVGKLNKGLGKGRPPLSFWPPNEPMAVGVIAQNLPASCWKSLVTKAGERGPIRYDWASVRVMLPDQIEGWLLIRRSLSDPDDLAFYLSNAGSEVSLKTLAKVALRRAEIEQCFAEAKTEAGMDEYEVRLYKAWHRHITLAMMAHAFLVTTKKTLEETVLRVGSPGERRCKIRPTAPRGAHGKRVLHEVAHLQSPETPRRSRWSIRGPLLSGVPK